jgi:hypothetical protein
MGAAVKRWEQKVAVAPTRMGSGAPTNRVAALPKPAAIRYTTTIKVGGLPAHR